MNELRELSWRLGGILTAGLFVVGVGMVVTPAYAKDSVGTASTTTEDSASQTLHSTQQEQVLPGESRETESIRPALSDSEDSSTKKTPTTKDAGKNQSPAAPQKKSPADQRAQDAKDTAKQEAGKVKPVGFKATVAKPGSTPKSPAAATGAPQPGVQPGAATGVTVVLGGEGTFDPIEARPLKYGDVPDVGETIDQNGKIKASAFLEMLSMATNWNILVTKDAKEVELECWLTKVKPKVALEVLKFHDLYYEYQKEGNCLYVRTKKEQQEKQFGDLVEREFVVKNAPVDYVQTLLSSLLSAKGRCVIDPRTHHAIIWDTKDNVDRMAKALDALDVPLVEADIKIQYANVAEVEQALKPMLSSGGTIVADPRSGHVILRDVSQNIALMKGVAAKLDSALETRTYTPNYVKVDSLAESLATVLSERGTAQVDPRGNTLVVTDLPARQEQVSQLVKALDRKLETRTWVLKYAKPKEVAERLENMVPEEMGDIITDDKVHQITVTAIPERIANIDALIQDWDKMRRQVQIEAYIVTASTDVARNLSVNWTYFGKLGGNPAAFNINDGATPDYTKLQNSLTLGQVPAANPQRNPITGEVIKDVNGKKLIDSFTGSTVAATINYLDQRGDVSIISTPRVTVQDGEEAIFKSGQKIPYVTSTTYGPGYVNDSTTSTNGTTSGTTTGTTTGTTSGNSGYVNDYYSAYGRPYNRVEFMDVGTILNVMPRIAEDTTVLLDISAEDSSADMKNTVIANGETNTVPLKKESRAETQVRVRDGETIVIGGLRTGNNTRSNTKNVPILADLPVVGNLFKSPLKHVQNQNLMIFLTTTIVDENTHPEVEQLAKTDEEFAKKLRTEKKHLFPRTIDKITRGKDEIPVAVGQGGDLYCEAKPVTLDGLNARLKEVKAPTTVVVVLRKHPRAPVKAVSDVTEAAKAAHIELVLDDSGVVPFVPSTSEQKAEAPSADAPAAQDKK